MKVEKFLKWSILDELYNERRDKFASNILKEMEKQNKELKTVVIDEKLTRKIKEYVTDKEKQNELLGLLNQYELGTNKDDDFGNKMYYKLGIYDCLELKNTLKSKIEEDDDKDEKNVFLDESSDDFWDYLNTNRMKMIKRNKKYKEFMSKREKIKEDNPNVRTFLEDREVIELTEVELNAVLDIFEIEGDMETIETAETFKLGAREMLIFLKQMGLI